MNFIFELWTRALPHEVGQGTWIYGAKEQVRVPESVDSECLAIQRGLMLDNQMPTSRVGLTGKVFLVLTPHD